MAYRVARCLRFSLKLINIVLLCVGVALLTYAGVMLQRLVDEDGWPPSSKPWRVPGPSPGPGSKQRLAPALSRLPRNRAGASQRTPSQRFIYAFIAAGGFVTLTAAAGLLGAACSSPRLLNAYAMLLTTALLLQAEPASPAAAPAPAPTPTSQPSQPAQASQASQASQPAHPTSAVRRRRAVRGPQAARPPAAGRHGRGGAPGPLPGNPAPGFPRCRPHGAGPASRRRHAGVRRQRGGAHRGAGRGGR